MSISWLPVVWIDIAGSLLTLVLAAFCARMAYSWNRKQKDDIFRHYIFLLTVAIVVFAVSRSFGHLVKQLLLYRNNVEIWQMISPYSGAVNTATFIIIFAFGLYFYRFHKIHLRLNSQKDELEEEIVQRKLVERQIEQAKKEWELTVDAIPDMIALLDNTCRILRVNRTMARRLGREPGEMVGDICCASLFASPAPLEDCPFSELSEGRESVMERYVEHLSAHLEIHMTPVLAPDGNLKAIVYLARDITRRKEAEKEKEKLHVNLLHAQKMESVGQLAAGIAHEINTPTQYISSNLDFLVDAFHDVSTLLHKYEELLTLVRNDEACARTVKDVDALRNEIDWEFLDTEIPQALEQSRDGTGRVSKIVRAMKEFSHPGGKEKNNEDLNKIIENTVTVTRNEWKYVSELAMDLEPDLPLIPCLRDELGQVILNIIVNAAQAIREKIGDNPEGEKGRIGITTRLRRDRVEIRIADNGVGMSEEVRARIFDPFFTTKTVGTGTGQGLSISHDVVVDKHGGTLACESTPEKGSVFIIGLPLE